jgi:Family of unknown function (DUF6194)
VCRVNVGVGKERFEALVGYAPAAHAGHRDDVDYAALDRLVPHPVYAPQGWVAFVSPASGRGELARALLADAHCRKGRRLSGKSSGLAASLAVWARGSSAVTVTRCF